MKRMLACLLMVALLAGTILIPAQPLSLLAAQRNEASHFPKAAIRAETLLAIEEEALSYDEKMFLVSLQGISANRSATQIFIYNYNNLEDLLYLQRTYHVALTYCANLEEVFTRLQADLPPEHKLTEYVYYDHSSEAGSKNAVSVATTMAGILQYPMVSKALEPRMKSWGLQKGFTVTRDMTEEKIWKDYGSRLNRKVAIELSEEYPGTANQAGYYLRDYAIMTGALTFYDTANGAYNGDTRTNFRSEICSFLEEDGYILGWSGYDEGAFIRYNSDRDISEIPADWALNLSVLSGFSVNALTQKAESAQEQSDEANVHYVAFAFSDGDNLQWFTSGYSTESSGRWFSSPRRGAAAVGWGLPPSAYDLAPTVMAKMYEKATEKDEFIIGPSGSGYMNPSHFSQPALTRHLRQLNEYCAGMDTGIVQIIDDQAVNPFTSVQGKDLFDQYFAQPNIDSLIYLDYGQYSKWGDSYYVNSDGKVAMSVTATYAHFGYAKKTPREIADYLNSRSTDITSKDAYTIISAVNWDVSYDDILAAVAQLNPNVRVVTPGQLLHQFKNNVLHLGNDYVQTAKGSALSSNAKNTSVDTQAGTRTIQTGNTGHWLWGMNAELKPGKYKASIVMEDLIGTASGNTNIFNIDLFLKQPGSGAGIRCLPTQDYTYAQVTAQPAPYILEYFFTISEEDVKAGNGAVTAEVRMWGYDKVGCIVKQVSVAALGAKPPEETDSVVYHRFRGNQGASNADQVSKDMDKGTMTVLQGKEGHWLYGINGQLKAGKYKAIIAFADIIGSTGRNDTVFNMDLYIKGKNGEGIRTTDNSGFSYQSIFRKNGTLLIEYPFEITDSDIQVSSGDTVSAEVRMWGYGQVGAVISEIVISQPQYTYQAVTSTETLPTAPLHLRAGRAGTLPKTITVVRTDRSTVQVPVSWQSGGQFQSDTEGIYSVSGKIQNPKEQIVSCQIQVTDPALSGDTALYGSWTGADIDLGNSTSGVCCNGTILEIPKESAGNSVNGLIVQLQPGFYQIRYKMRIRNLYSDLNSTLLRIKPTVMQTRNGGNKEYYVREVASKDFAAANQWTDITARFLITPLDLPAGADTAAVNLCFWNHGRVALDVAEIQVAGSDREF